MAKRKKHFKFKFSASDLLFTVNTLKGNEIDSLNESFGTLSNAFDESFGKSMTEKEKDDFIILSTKTIICETAGLTINPLQLPNKTLMNKFEFNDIQNLRVAQRFTSVANVFKANALIIRDNVEDCASVDDCIKLVKDNS